MTRPTILRQVHDMLGNERGHALTGDAVLTTIYNELNDPDDPYEVLADRVIAHLDSRHLRIYVDDPARKDDCWEISVRVIQDGFSIITEHHASTVPDEPTLRNALAHILTNIHAWKQATTR